MTPIPMSKRLSEGWKITGGPNGSGARIARVKPGEFDEFPTVFETDEQAVKFVQAQAKAKAGSEYHIECLMHVATRNLRGHHN